MKKILAAFFLLLASLVYIIFQVTKKELYLSSFSINADNPVSFNWRNIEIDTKFQPGDSGSIHLVSMFPVYTLVFLALILIVFSLKKKT